MITTREAVRWRKSSLSSGQDSCVELAHTGNAVRDSKNPTGPTLNVDLSRMLPAIRAGRFDR